jgi:hypothetical protein
LKQKAEVPYTRKIKLKITKGNPMQQILLLLSRKTVVKHSAANIYSWSFAKAYKKTTHFAKFLVFHLTTGNLNEPTNV